MNGANHHQPADDEQRICVTCGFCCDGTLFLRANLKPGEKGNLPEKIEENYRKEPEIEYFVLPCKYFVGRCSIYDQKKAKICSSYRCQLLKDFALKSISLDDALDIVKGARQMRSELMGQFRNLAGNKEDICFAQQLLDIGKTVDTYTAGSQEQKEVEMLIARCNVFEALLIKHIRSVTDFEAMVES